MLDQTLAQILSELYRVTRELAEAKERIRQLEQEKEKK